MASLVLWAVFVFVQTVQHRDYFLPGGEVSNEEVHAAPPSLARAWASLALLLVCLIAVVGLAKVLSPSIEAGLAASGAPKTVLEVGSFKATTTEQTIPVASVIGALSLIGGIGLLWVERRPRLVQ